MVETIGLVSPFDHDRAGRRNRMRRRATLAGVGLLSVVTPRKRRSEGAMKHLKLIGLVLTAVFAVTAFSATAASATLPEITFEGKEVAVGTPIKSKSGKSTLETKSGEKVSCTADTNSGEVTGVKTSKTTVTFTGCSAFGILKCSTTGAKSGEIILKSNVKVVYISKSAKEVGLAFELEKEVVIECTSSEKLHVRGGNIGKLTPVNSPTSKPTLTFAQTKGVQSPTEYENESGGKVKLITETSGEGLKKFAFEQSGLSSTDELEFGSPAKTVEVKG
jgi:hypothetical protein